MAIVMLIIADQYNYYDYKYVVHHKYYYYNHRRGFSVFPVVLYHANVLLLCKVLYTKSATVPKRIESEIKSTAWCRRDN